MGVKRKALTAMAAAALMAGIAASAAPGAHRADPGITATSIKIGGTFPLTGVASLYKTIPFAEKAYFDYTNEQGGVNGRKITFEILDDSYDPSKTVPLTQQLVEQDQVFADFGSLGTAPNLSVWGYLNQHKVPHLGLATGDSYWGFSAKRYPWTVGWQPDYPGEGKVYGQYIVKNMPSAKVGVLFQNDAFGKNYYAGLRVGMGAKKSQIVSAQSYDPSQTTLTQQILALKSAGADTLVIFALPTQTIVSLVTAGKVGWSPQVFLGNVSANRVFMLAAGASGASLDGVISTSYLDSSSYAAQANTTGVKLGTDILTKYAPSLLPSWKNGDANVMYGLAQGWTFVNALSRAGKNPTRASIVKAYKTLNTSKNPFVYPGIKLQTSATDNFPIEQETLIKWQGGATGDWAPFGKLYDHVR